PAQKSKAVAKAAANKRDIEVEVDEDLTKELQTLQASIQNEEQQLEADRQEAEARLEEEKARLQQSGEARREKVLKAVMTAPKKHEPISFEERYRLYSEEENEEALEALVRARQKELRLERERIREEFQMSLDELYNKA